MIIRWSFAGSLVFLSIPLPREKCATTRDPIGCARKSPLGSIFMRSAKRSTLESASSAFSVMLPEQRTASIQIAFSLNSPKPPLCPC